MYRVVLVRPQGPRNVGSTLRLVANFGPAELVLVAPTRPSLLLHPDFEQMSHGVEDVAAKIAVVRTLGEALADCTFAFGFTARGRDHRALCDWRDARDDLIARARASEERVALVFGSEENGLTGAEVAPLQELVRFPTSDQHTSLNLSMSVGLVLSAIFFAEAPSARSETSSPIDGAARALLIERMKEVLGRQGTSAPARRDIVSSIERVFSVAPLETRDARAWHLLVRALNGEAGRRDDVEAPGDELRSEA